MRALTVEPGRSAPVEVTDLPTPEPGPGEVLVQGLAMGVCGTDREIADGEYGSAPPGADRLIIGHESLGRVITAPDSTELTEGDLVVGVVRRPDPEPCGACARGEFDMCRNGRYRERGIKELHGYGAETWTVEADYAVRVDPALGTAAVLLEPASVVAKAWDQIRAVGQRSWFEPRRLLVTGAGPIGLLAALLGVQQGLDVHVLDRVTGGAKPRLVEDLGATYHHDPADEVARGLQPDMVIEATGAGQVVFDTMANTATYSVVCLTGVSSPGRTLTIDAGLLNRDVVLENDVVVGSVNANRHHYAAAADALAAADRDWLLGLITRRVPIDRAAEAFQAEEDDVKVVITLTDEPAARTR